MIVFFALTPKTAKKITGSILKFLHKIHIVKNIDKTEEKVFGEIEKYSQCIKKVINMIDIEKECFRFLNDLNKSKSSEEFLVHCVYDKLNKLYAQQSEKYDSLINTLYKMIDMEDISGMCTVIKKLSKNINSNRQQLISLLERIG
jgi:hypothetical protein